MIRFLMRASERLTRAQKKRYAEAELEQLSPEALKTLLTRWVSVIDRELKEDGAAAAYVSVAMAVQVAVTAAVREAWDRGVTVDEIRRALHVTLDAQFDAIESHLER